MSDLDALLAGIVANPTDALRWLVMADWLEDHGQPERAELVRVHRELLRTCTATRETKARKQLHVRMMELMRAGVQPCLPQRTIVLPDGVEMRFSFIPPGSFLMGSPKSEKERIRDERRHQVTLTKGFWMSKTPVTQVQWVAVMGDNPSLFKGDSLPVETLQWDSAQAFYALVSRETGVTIRLPTEAEWEYACRAGTTTPFYWGTELNGAQANCNGNYAYGTEDKGPYLGKTSVAGSYQGVSPHPWDLVDMIGNVSEWCQDGLADYPYSRVSDPVVPVRNRLQSLRGGNSYCYARVCRVARRNGSLPGLWDSGVGIRLALDPSGSG